MEEEAGGSWQKCEHVYDIRMRKIYALAPLEAKGPIRLMIRRRHPKVNGELIDSNATQPLEMVED